MEDKLYYYPTVGCATCSDIFREFFMFCYRNIIPYELKRNVKVELDEPAIRWGEDWFIGEDAVDKFKEAWTLRKGKNDIL